MKDHPFSSSSEDYDPSDLYQDYDIFEKGHRKVTINWRLLLSIIDIVYVLDTTVTCLSILTNLLHLMVLTRKSMRRNVINIIMIGISTCDILWLSLATFLVFGNSIDGLDECTNSPYLVAIYVDWTIMTLFDITRRCSTYLGLFMAFFRMLTVLFPMSRIAKSINKSISGILLVLGTAVVCGVWDTSFYLHYSIRNLKGKKDCNGKKYKVDTYEYTDLPSQQSTMEAYALVDSISHLANSALYLLITVILVLQLRKIQDRRKSLHQKEEDKTLIVIVFAAQFFVCETFYGLIFLADTYWAPKDVNVLFTINRILFMSATLFALNSFFQSTVSIFLSAQYRKTAREVFVFWRKAKKVQIVSVSSERNLVLQNSSTTRSRIGKID